MGWKKAMDGKSSAIKVNTKENILITNSMGMGNWKLIITFTRVFSNMENQTAMDSKELSIMNT